MNPIKDFPIYYQRTSFDCGPACLKMISDFHKNKTINILNGYCTPAITGTSIKNLSNAAEKMGYRALAIKIPFSKLISHVPLPVIAFWKNHHFLIIYYISKKIIYIADPNIGLSKYNYGEFLDKWVLDNNKKQGVILCLEPRNNLTAECITAQK